MSIIDMIEKLKRDHGSGDDWDIVEEHGDARILLEKKTIPGRWRMRIIPTGEDFKLVWGVRVTGDNNKTRPVEQEATTSNETERAAVRKFYDDIISQKEEAPTTMT